MSNEGLYGNEENFNDDKLTSEMKNMRITEKRENSDSEENYSEPKSTDEKQTPTYHQLLPMNSRADSHVVNPSKKKSIKDFKIGRVLGEGSYSTVVKATDIVTDKEYALKIMLKLKIIKEKKKHWVSREKSILTMLAKVPFFVQLYFTFQDEDNLYYGLTLAQGGEILYYMKTLKRFSVSTTKFYIAEIFSAVFYLHSTNIVHRDLKPENILLGDNLHILITDFGTSKMLTDENEVVEEGRNQSFVGTAQYVSPEMLKRSYSNKSSDIWSVGVTMFQMLTGGFPFQGGNEYYIFQKIMKLEYNIPSDMDRDASDLISKILVLDINTRLGCREGSGFKDIKDHVFFRNVNWTSLIEQDPPAEIKNSYQEFKNKKSVDLESSDENNFFNNENEFLRVDSNISDKAHSPNMERSKSDNRFNYDVWKKFTEGNEIIKMGLLFKKKGLVPRKRMFIITEGPNIYYVDPLQMELKGSIPWTKELHCSVKNFSNFNIHTPKRIYILEDRYKTSNKWVDVIEQVHKKYFG